MNKVLTEAPVGYNRVQLKYGPYSPSRLIVARCPSRFQSKYIFKDKIVGDATAAARGSVIHHVLEQITNSHAAKTPLTPAKINAWIEQGVAKYPAAYDEIRMIKEACNAYAGNPSPYMNETTKCELGLAVEMYEEESFIDDAVLKKQFVAAPYSRGSQGQTGSSSYFAAIIDQLSIDEVTQTITILDHKSTISANKNPDHEFQLGCYAWITSLFYPGYAIRTVIHYANANLNFYSTPTYWTSDDLQAIGEEVQMRIKVIESFEQFPAIPGSSCDYCHMVQLCPENIKIQEQNARGEINLNIRSVDEAIQLGKQVRTTGALYDQIYKVLKDSIERLCPEGGISLEGYWYGFKVSDEKIDWDATDEKIREESFRAKKLLESGDVSPADRAQVELMAKLESLENVLIMNGLNPENYKAWRPEKLKATGKMDIPGLHSVITKLGVKEKSTRFSGYKN